MCRFDLTQPRPPDARAAQAGGGDSARSLRCLCWEFALQAGAAATGEHLGGAAATAHALRAAASLPDPSGDVAPLRWEEGVCSVLVDRGSAEQEVPKKRGTAVSLQGLRPALY